jgi:hypothetical protein
MMHVNLIKNFLKAHIDNCRIRETVSKDRLDQYELHTELVCNYIVDIGESLSLPKFNIELAATIALIHDLAAFEKNWTAQDLLTENYVNATIKMLDDRKILDGFLSNEYQIITKAIALHNVPTLPEIDDDTILFYTKLIRDADKLAIWNQMSKMIIPYQDTSCDIPDSIFQTIFQQKAARFVDAESDIHRKIITISWIFDLNFVQSFQIAKKNNWFETIFSKLPQNKKINIIHETVSEFLEYQSMLPPRSDFDSPWKIIIDQYFKDFMDFFYPAISKDIDWQKGFSPLDKELDQISREAKMGGRFADKMMQVYKISGEETCVMCHIEIQGQKETDFSHRSFIYNYRAHEYFNKPVVSLSIFTDKNKNWRPIQFERELWGCKTVFTFNSVKLAGL